jgi:hypothetical protein
VMLLKVGRVCREFVGNLLPGTAGLVVQKIGTVILHLAVGLDRQQVNRPQEGLTKWWTIR